MKARESRIPNLRSEMGFTLIEVTIAMVLLSLIALVTYGSFYLGHRAMEKIQTRAEQNQKLRSWEDFLATYIRSAYPCRSSPQDPSVSFSGTEGGLTFISALSLGMGGRGMSRVTVSWVEDGQGSGSLSLEEAVPLSVGCQEGGEGYRNTVVLSEGIKGLSIDYLDPQGEDESWVERWDGREKRVLPRAVRFNVRGDEGEVSQWTFPIMMSVLGR